MILHPSIPEMSGDERDNAFSVVMAAAKHAREIADQAKDKEEILVNSPLMISVRDFASGKTKIKH